MRVPAVIAARGSAAVGWARGSNRNRTLISLSFDESGLGLRSLEFISRSAPERLANINEVLSEVAPPAPGAQQRGEPPGRVHFRPVF